MKKIHIYFHKQPVGYRWIPGDKLVVNFFKRLINVLQVSGAEKVFVNLCKGFDELNIPYTKNLSFEKIKPDEPVLILGDEHYNSKFLLLGYNKPNLIIAGIALMTHPSEWPDLIQQYPIAKYLQHCTWANDLFSRYYGENNCEIWPAGIDTKKWAPPKTPSKKTDILIYNKIRWDVAYQDEILRKPILKKISEMGLTYREIVYGDYKERDYFKLLKECRAMIFLCEHETQGFALCEALSADMPVLAWDSGYCQDPNRFNWNDPIITTMSVPYFDERCGMTFTNLDDFNKKVATFWAKVKADEFDSRKYILENLTLKKSAELMLKIIEEIY